MGMRLGNRNTINALRRGGGIPFKDDLRLWTKSRTDLSMVDEYTNSPEILMPVASFNGSDDYLLSGENLTGGEAIELEFEFILKDYSANNCVFSCGGYSSAVKGLAVWVDSGERVEITTASGSATALIEMWDLSVVDVGKKIRIKLVWDGLTGGTMTGEIWGDQITIGGVGVVDYNKNTSTSTHGWSGDSSEVITIGCYRPSSPLGNFGSEIISTKLDGYFDIYPNGQGLYEYDVNGNMNFTWNGTGDKFIYSALGDSYFLDNGWLLYINGANKEYVPVNGDVTVIVAAGYTLATYGTYNNIRGINMFPCLVDMNPESIADAFLQVMDRSNTTYQNAVSRAADNYDAANPFRYYITELADPRIYTTYFTVDHAGKFYAKIKNQNVSGTYYIKSIDEIILYLTDKTGADQYSVMSYCGSNVYAL